MQMIIKLKTYIIMNVYRYHMKLLQLKKRHENLMLLIGKY